MSRKIVIISILMMLLCLTACTKKFEEEDVKKYIRDDMHISSFKILSGPVDVKGEDGYTDQEWTVSTDVFDLGEDLVFHVYNDVYYSMEWTTNRLDDDLLYQKQLVLLANCDLPDGVTTEEVKGSSGRPWSVSLVHPLANRSDFANASSAITRLQPSLASVPEINDTDFSFCLKVKVSDPSTDAGIANRQYSFNFNSKTAPSEISDSISKQSDEYLMDCIEKGLLDRMDEYSIEERSAVINAQSNNTEIRRMDEDTAAYPGYAYNYYYDIPYGTLYRILEQEGYELTGDWKSFSFVGKDGEEYAFAYGAGQTGEATYAYRENVISVDEINAITDLNLDDGAEPLEVVVDSDMLGLFGEDADAFASKLLALDGNYFREVNVAGGEVHIRGKGRQFARLRRLIDDRLEALANELRAYNGGYCFVYDNMSRVYQGIKIRFGADVPIETTRRVVDEAVALTAFSQILNMGKVYDWNLEVAFATWKDSESETVLVYQLPEDEIDYEAVYRALERR
jgi:hypothetical protein